VKDEEKLKATNRIKNPEEKKRNHESHEFIKP
jgi:hypothetical protein